MRSILNAANIRGPTGRKTVHTITITANFSGHGAGTNDNGEPAYHQLE